MTRATLRFNLESLMARGVRGLRVPEHAQKLATDPQHWEEIRVNAQEKGGRKLRAAFKFRPGRAMSLTELGGYVFERITREMGTVEVMAQVHAQVRA